MLSELRKSRYPAELCLLIAFCLFLPLVEFWKNLALVSYAVAWLVNRARSRDFGGAWRTSDTIVALWIVAAYLAAVFAGLEGRAIAKTGDVLASAVLFWMVSRAAYAPREIVALLGAIVVSTLAGLLHGYWRISQLTVAFDHLQLYSVGHVNHTAIYLAIVFGLCVSWLFAGWRSWAPRPRLAVLATVAFFAMSLVVTTSRAAVAIAFPLVLVLAAAWWRVWRLPLVVTAAAAAVGAMLLVGLGADVVRKQVEYSANKNMFSFRDGIWRTGLAGWEKYPWFGVGKDNYGHITRDRIRAWRLEAGKEYDEKRYVPAGHAHNLYINTLAERGAAGAAMLLAALVAGLYALWRHRPRAGADTVGWLAWGGAASAWIVTAGIGVVNTTLHHEHGLLAALLFGLWLSTLHPRTPPRGS